MAPAEHTQLHESPWDQMMAQIGQERWKHYKKDIVPIENRYIENVKWMGTPEAADQTAGLAVSGVRSQADPLIQNAQEQMAVSGLNPNSGAYKMKVADMNNRVAAGVADADITARTGQKNEYLKGLEGVVAMGNNQAGESIANMSDVAGMARDRAITNADMNAKESMALGSGIGTAAGLGLGTYARKYGGM